MITKIRRLFFGKKGQGMVEYLLIVGLIALMVYATIKVFGTKVQGAFDRAGEKVTEATTW